ncbi:hypothetical protein CHGG_07942 [Chaetomium globosum CBS 148.51]|uniref:Trichothecene 3-O-acetyltransferase-like N-terminal domain-containing protein n=1 Tax=Chaetomium globosum (strain ATCC 6205 / CBS 148.51 / DSM 1962 / NBRC 6347 / NRRL 1970) TaxID=306901 RepID=Q2GVR2_CHAGB|nr:uncharacterized protein CHGG_07942 [Chaetomium globosum CBS 148.51]EAQ86689.1 hypothetical protein CHGG_07942 [Chaetomium globosum CBS 148.51]
MPEQQVYHIHPLGWENDPDEERYRVSPLDYVGTCVFNNYALYFKLKDEEKLKVLEVLRSGLERTLSQTRHLTSTIEEGPDGDHWFVRRYDNTVELRAQWLDSPKDAEKYPSLQDMENSHFSALTLGDLDLWRIPHMRYGADNPAAHPDLHPAVTAFKASFVRGGLVLVTHMHHLANDLSGWASFVRQLADNCRAALTGTPYPPWDPACLTVTRRLAKPPIPEAEKGGAKACSFTSPNPKAPSSKASGNPHSHQQQPQPQTAHPSTYAATTALLLHILTRLRHPHYSTQIPLTARPLWAEVIDMRRRCATAHPDFGLGGPIPPRMQRNLLSAAVSRLEISGVGRGPTVGGLLGTATGTRTEVTCSGGGGEGEEEEVWPLHRTAAWVRDMTEAAGTRAVLQGLHDQFHVLRDRTRAAADLHDLPALAVAVSDHREAAALIGDSGGRDEEGEGAEFGFGRPVAYRQLWGRVDVGLVIVYPARAGMLGEDEGLEFTIGYEKALAKELVEDEEFGKWFEYRGVDWEEE